MNGALAIVVKRTAKAHQPVVRALTDANGEPIEEGRVCDTSDSAFQVAAAVNPTDVKVEHDLNHIFHAVTGKGSA